MATAAFGMRLAELSSAFARLTNRAGLEVSLRRVLRSTSRRRVVYFLHIGKAAGSQVKQMMAQVNREADGVLMKGLSHDVTLADLPEPADYFFSIRDPISRFRSGFYSRKRRGRPLNDIAWTPHEETAFANFEHAADLAEALFAPGEEGMRAAAAMKSIRHTAQDQIDWFALAGDIFTVRPPVWVLRQEHLEADMKVLLDRLGVDFTPEARRDAKGAHANDYAGIPDLTETGIANLKRWYAQDVAFYEAVETWMSSQRSE
ncbi:sulfotransferase family 2 domain-containing protein [Erythrobacter sp. JK5]|uniref:sulfotransferase family 2 domain-containing protein n=1 Tax=Erythrobacter sp. JK5 TaxID=2829500 RepID=UPI001BAD14C0|nr:sulfotransferase family 2 domain-containing protein [Erythrobacter sp. JK5]QUL37664.1 hypothetical protein KDC96_15165 [Erythrobacter sp. JK5]